jgi:hypothetical protein
MQIATGVAASCGFHWLGFNWHVELFLDLKLLNREAQAHIPKGLDPRLIRFSDILQTVYRHCTFGRQSVIVIFYKLCTATVPSVDSLSSWYSTNCVPPLYFRSTVCHRDVLQTVYRHCTFGRQSVIVIFYKLCTATVPPVSHAQPDYYIRTRLPQPYNFQESSSPVKLTFYILERYKSYRLRTLRHTITYP